MINELKRWALRSYVRTRELGFPGARHSLYLFHRGLWRLGQSIPIGTNVFERDWDVLVILDACRVDLMCEVASKYNFIDEVESVWSVGSTSSEWLKNTFIQQFEEYINSTVYVSANPFTSTALDYAPQLKKLDEVWQYGFDKDLGTIPPRRVTDRAIHAGRELNPSRLIVHYMQPHHPFIAENAPLANRSSISDIVKKRQNEQWEWTPGEIHGNNIWLMYGRGEISYEDLWTSYRLTLEMILTELETLLSNLDAKDVIITADHGNAMGEWRMYGHPAGFLHPAVRKVLWIETTAQDEYNYTPSIDPEPQDNDISELLAALGYA